MSSPCAVVQCNKISQVLCYCCDKNLCLEHISNHDSLKDCSPNSLTDEINRVNDRLKKLDVDKLVDETRLKLDKWRDNSLKQVNRFYENKCEELDRYYNKRIRQQQKNIDQLYIKLSEINEQQNNASTDIINQLKTKILHVKDTISEIEQKIIPMQIRSLSIDNNLIIIGDINKKGFDLHTLLPPYQKLDVFENSGFGLASNDECLLVDLNYDLSLFDKDLKVIKQSRWDYGTIHDVCWSQGLASFIAITENSKAFLINGNNLSVHGIEQMQNHLWMSCACSKSLLYLASLSNAIVEFSLLPTFSYTRRWDPPITCNKNEHIKSIACNDEKLALMVALFSDNILHLVVRSLTTFHQIFSIRLDVKSLLYDLPIRCCSLKHNEWLVVEANTSQLFHIDEDGKLKGRFAYDEPPHNAAVFDRNILVIRTHSTIYFHQVLH